MKKRKPSTARYQQRRLRRGHGPEPSEHGADVHECMPAVGGEQLNGVNIDGREDHADGELPDTGQRNYSIRCWGHWLYYLIIFVVAHFILITFKKKVNFFPHPFGVE